MKKKYKVGAIEVHHIYRPGEVLDEVSLKKMHNELVRINEKSGANVANKMLEKTLSLDEIRVHYKNVVLAMLYNNQEPWAFLISPLLSSTTKPILHAGLIIAQSNPGVDLISLLAIGSFQITYKNVGNFYSTNISSTPSIIESMTHLIPDVWPSPDVELKVVPKGYKEVVKILKEDYMDKYFPNPEKLEVNYKRFTLTSNSQEMGFVTDFYKISRSSDFKYLSFCRTWIDYSKEEDIIQVGEINFYKNLRMSFLLWKLKQDLKKAEKKLAVKEVMSMKERKIDKKAA